MKTLKQFISGYIISNYPTCKIKQTFIDFCTTDYFINKIKAERKSWIKYRPSEFNTLEINAVNLIQDEYKNYNVTY